MNVSRPNRRALLTLLPVALLAACAPAAQQTQSPVSVATTVSGVSFYPAQTGLTWQYTPEGEPQGQAPYVLRVTGPTLFLNQPVTAYQLTGRGADQTWYRQVSDAGVKLLGFTKPGLTVTLNPAWTEAPAANTWRAGLTWSGRSQVQVVQGDKVVQEGAADYTYTVLEQRNVIVNGQPYQVWVVNRQIKGDLGALFPASQDYWFAPRVGDIRTPEALLLTARNFKGG
ncbi:hypothetical protein [Deinococcus maricopensis]|nr:hypothetical protein [Deinococcus maricopensis]